MTAEPQPGTSLETRGETLPDVAVPNRAGAIVSEFVSSIVEEAQLRATEIMAEAEADGNARIWAAHEGAARVGKRAQAVADEFARLHHDLHRAGESLQADPAVRAAAALPVPETVGEALVVADDEIQDATVVDATVVDEELVVIADSNGTPDIDPNEVEPRLTRMSDEELSRAYSHAVRAAAAEGADDEQGARLRELADAVVSEALSRPAFTEEDPPPSGLRKRSRARRQRRRAVALAELREACRRAADPAQPWVG